MNEANYGKCRDLSVIWEFSKYATNRKYAPSTSAPTACAKYIVLKKPMKVNAICQISDTMLCRCIGSMDMMREKKVFSLNMVCMVSSMCQMYRERKL